MTTNIRMLKGDTFENRYLICGRLTALSSFHIGSGETVQRSGLVNKKKNNKPIDIEAVAVDHNERSYIPGSSLRGSLRDWLRQRFNLRDDRDQIDQRNNKQEEQAKYLRSDETSIIERLLGTVLNSTKVSVWDARYAGPTPITDDAAALSHWSKKRLTYVAKAVSINSETGTADENKLYNFELVPEGAVFDVILAAQNLDPDEVAFLLSALDGFNDPNDPITLAAMGGRGFGRFKFELGSLYRIDKSKIEKWKQKSKATGKAGYESIREAEFVLSTDEVERLTGTLSLTKKLASITRLNWTLKLETPLCIKSGSFFGWSQNEQPKASKMRNQGPKYDWLIVDENEIKNAGLTQISDLAIGLKLLDNGTVDPFYQVPASSIRGAIRNWAITHLLPDTVWGLPAAESEATKRLTGDARKHFDYLRGLFGFAAGGDAAGSMRGRLQVETKPFSAIAANKEKPKIEGTWNPANTKYGPSNAVRHISVRNPLDRCTQAAVDGGLHNFLEFSLGQTFEVTLKIRDFGNAEDGYDKLMENKLKQEINDGMLRFGGLQAIGRGRMCIPTDGEVSDGKS